MQNFVLFLEFISLELICNEHYDLGGGKSVILPDP